MTNGRAWRYPKDFRCMAVEQFKKCENIEWLAKEPGVPRQTLYRWHEESERAEVGAEQPTEKSRESRLRREISDLKRLFAEKTFEVDFFGGTLQKVETRHRQSYDHIRNVVAARWSTQMPVEFRPTQPHKLAHPFDAQPRTLRLPTNDGRVAASGNVGQPQKSSTAHERGQSYWYKTGIVRYF
jgi:hypothetical protein